MIVIQDNNFKSLKQSIDLLEDIQDEKREHPRVTKAKQNEKVQSRKSFNRINLNKTQSQSPSKLVSAEQHNDRLETQECVKSQI